MQRVRAWLQRTAVGLPAYGKQARRTVRRLATSAQAMRPALEQMLASSAPEAVRAQGYAALLALVAADDVAEAVLVGSTWLPSLATSASAHRTLARWQRRGWAIIEPLRLCERARELDGRYTTLHRQLNREAELLTAGMPLTSQQAPAYAPVQKRMVYVVASSLPFHSAGYGTRTHGLVQGLVAQGWEVHVVARPGYPNDRWDYPHLALAPQLRIIDGVHYHFRPHRQILRYSRDPYGYHQASAEVLEAICRELRPAVIHAASNYNVGLLAVEVAHRLGVTAHYELRGLWNVTKAAATPAYMETDHYRMVMRLEAQAAGAADRVFAITSGLANVMIDHGVPAERITLLPNAAEVERFTPRPPDAALVAALGLQGKTVLGYVGSLNPYEGIDDLLYAMAELRELPLHLLIVGDGVARASLEALVVELQLGPRVHFIGRVAPGEVPRYYSVIDVLVLPRKPELVCELVSPMKPFEAWAMGKPVLASNVAALADIVQDGVNGWLFEKGSREALCNRIIKVCEIASGSGFVHLPTMMPIASWDRAGCLILECLR